MEGIYRLGLRMRKILVSGTIYVTSCYCTRIFITFLYITNCEVEKLCNKMIFHLDIQGLAHGSCVPTIRRYGKIMYLSIMSMDKCTEKWL